MGGDPGQVAVVVGDLGVAVEFAEVFTDGHVGLTPGRGANLSSCGQGEG